LYRSRAGRQITELPRSRSPLLTNIPLQEGRRDAVLTAAAVLALVVLCALRRHDLAAAIVASR
jgi:hypothetical protein